MSGEHSGKQCRLIPWSGAAFCGVWSGSKLFTNTWLSLRVKAIHMYSLCRLRYFVFMSVRYAFFIGRYFYHIFGFRKQSWIFVTARNFSLWNYCVYRSWWLNSNFRGICGQNQPIAACSSAQSITASVVLLQSQFVMVAFINGYQNGN